MSRNPTTTPNPKIETTPVPRVSFSIEEAAGALGIGRTYVYQLIKEGRLKVVRLGRRTLVPLDALNDLLRINASGAPADSPTAR